MAKNTMFSFMSEDKNIIPSLLKILEREQMDNNSMVEAMNLNLSRNTAGLEMYVTASEGDKKQRNFLLSETESFYKKWKHKVGNIFINYEERNKNN